MGQAERNPKAYVETPRPHGARNLPFGAWSGVGTTLHEVLRKLLFPFLMFCSTPSVDRHEGKQTGLNSGAHQPMSALAMFGYRAAGQHSESHSTCCTTSCLCHHLSVAAVTLITVLLPKERVCTAYVHICLVEGYSRQSWIWSSYFGWKLLTVQTQRISNLDSKAC